MCSLRNRLFWPFAFVACFAIAPGVIADESATASRLATAEHLVQQLGVDSYAERQLARQQLLEIGLAAKAALDVGMRDPNPEIALRCRRLWDEVRILVGWQQVRPDVGDSPEARALFHKMFLADPALWYGLAENPRPLDGLFPERRAQLQQTLKDGPALTWMMEGALANAFYFGVLAKRARPEEQLDSMDELMRLGRCQQALKDDEPLRDLWDMWAKATESDGPALDRLLAALQNQRPQAHEIACAMLADLRVPVTQRQYALLALAKIKDPADDELIRPLMTDSTALDTLVSKGSVVRSQLRDVALAVTIYRAGRDPRDFGFAFLKTDPATLFSPSTLGFKTDEERGKALKKWTEFVAAGAGGDRVE